MTRSRKAHHRMLEPREETVSARSVVRVRSTLKCATRKPRRAQTPHATAQGLTGRRAVHVTAPRDYGDILRGQAHGAWLASHMPRRPALTHRPRLGSSYILTFSGLQRLRRRWIVPIGTPAHPRRALPSHANMPARSRLSSAAWTLKRSRAAFCRFRPGSVASCAASSGGAILFKLR